MALAIDTRHLLERWIPDQEDYLDAYVGTRGRFQLHRVLAYATVVCSPSTIKLRHCDQDVQQAALDWPADPDDDLHEVEAFHHLQQLSTTSSSVRDSISKAITTTLVASVELSNFSARAQDRSPSSFHRYSVRMIMEDKGNGHTYASKSTLSKVIPGSHSRRGCLWACVNDPKIVWTRDIERYDLLVVWHIQLDFVDLFSPIADPDSSPGKRRRTLNLFQQVPSRCEEDGSRGSHPPEAKRFKGVRFRPERRKWIAEMKPPKSRNKVSLGDFRSQIEAARVVDVAFYHFGKPLNFVDTPQILSTLPTSVGLDEEDKLKLVKEQAKWLASRASTLRSTPTSPFTEATSGATSSVPFEVSESSTICTAVTSGFRSFSEITSPISCGGTDEADDGIFQPDPLAGFVVNVMETMEPGFTLADHRGFISDLEEEQSMFLQSGECQS